MKNTLMTLTIFGLLLTGCGSSDSTSVVKSQDEVVLDTTSNTRENREETVPNEKQIAIDNVANSVTARFRGYKIVVYSDKDLEEQTSYATKVIYGNINGESTTSLLTISNNYTDGDVFWVKVFNGDELVGESDKVVLNGESVEFGDIWIDGGER